MDHQQLVDLARTLIAQMGLHATEHHARLWTSFQVSNRVPYRLFVHRDGVAWNGGQRFEIQMNISPAKLRLFQDQFIVPAGGVAAVIPANYSLRISQHRVRTLGAAAPYRYAVRFTPNATPAQIQAVLTAALTDAYYP